MEHHSNIVPWQMLCERTGAKLKIIPLKSDLTLDFESFKSLINEHTKLVSIAQISNVLGICNPIDEIVKECKKIDEEYNTSRMSIETYRQKIAEIFDRLEIVSRNRGG